MPSRPKAAPGRDGLLADIRGGARLKKVADSEKRDRSAAAVPGQEPASPAPGAAAAGGGAAAGGMAGALASALAARKAKVSHSGELCPFSICDVLKDGRCTDGEVQMTRRMMMIGERESRWFVWVVNIIYRAFSAWELLYSVLVKYGVWASLVCEKLGVARLSTYIRLYLVCCWSMRRIRATDTSMHAKRKREN